ncbi:MAG: hypothetical protein ACFFAN_20350 [Promethearchaeota archaeon]
MIRIQKYVVNELGVELGHYLDFSNSLHIYGNSISEVKNMIKRMKTKGEILPEEAIELINKNEK